MTGLSLGHRPQGYARILPMRESDVVIIGSGISSANWCEQSQSLTLRMLAVESETEKGFL